jgi:amino acid adenylation domain-containing protein
MVVDLHAGGSPQEDGLVAPSESADDRPELVPCSSAQRQLWLFERLNPGNAAYLVSGVVRICGTLDVVALRGAFDDCVRRHESLRTRIVEVDGEPWQCIEHTARMPFELTDLSGRAQTALHPEVIERAIAFAHTPLPLAAAPLARVLLIRLSEREVVLALTVHHIIFDGWSMSVLLRDIAALYSCRRNPVLPPPPDPPIQYADFSEWQREQIATGWETLKKYWRERLDGLSPLELPTDRPRATIGRGAARAVTISIDSAQTEALHGLARRHGVTLFIVLLAAFKLLLWRLTGQADIAVGVPTARRDRAELRDLVGFVANTLVLRTLIPAAGDVPTLLARVREVTLGALGHAELPLELLTHESAPVRNRPHEPPFRTLFAMQPEPDGLIGGADLLITPIPIPPVSPKADLLVEVTERASSCDVRFEFDEALFDRPTVERHARAYQAILARMAAHPTGTLDETVGADITAILAGPEGGASDGCPASNVIEFPGRLEPSVTGHDDFMREKIDRAGADSVETAVRQIWKDLLPTSAADLDDNFFACGGSSLLAAQLWRTIRARLGVDLPLATVFQHSTLGELARAVAEAMRVPAADSRIEPISRFSALPLSHAQARMWFMQQLEPASTAYTLFGAVQIEGPLDTERLIRALEALHQRHETLRTKFREFGGRPVQIIVPSVSAALPIDDLMYLEGEARDAEVQRIARLEAGRPFNLDKLPILRTRLVRLGQAEHILLASLHHIAGDGWSIRLLWRDLTELYAADAETRAASLPVLPIQYADYAQWQGSRFSTAELDRLIGYWRHRLAGLAVLDLPTDHPRQPVQNDIGRRFAFEIPAHVVTQVTAVAARFRATPFMVLAAGFQALLARYSGQDDIAIGVPVASRDHPEVQNLVGCFVNMIVLRGDLAGNPSFSEVVCRVRESALGAFAHQHLPFEKLVEALQPDRDLNRHALFQVLFDYQELEPHVESHESLRLRPLDIDSGVSQFDLAVYLEAVAGLPAAEPIRGALVYRTDLFDAATIERMAGALVRLLAALVNDAERPIAAHDMLSFQERRQLKIWNETQVDLGPPALLDELIVAQAQITPQAIAVSTAKDSMNYRELLGVTGSMAGRLQALGAGPDKIVAVCLERDVAMPVALLSVLRSGAAYLPLDPELPADRLAFMMKDADPVALLTSERLRHLFPTGVPFIDAEEWFADARRSPMTEPPVRQRRGDSDLAYVIYTSGSTGQPKGAMIPHRGIVNRLRWMQAAYGLEGGDRVLQKTPYSFDVSVWEFFWPMMTGGTLVMAAPGAHRDPDYLVTTIEQAGITTIHFVPSMLDVFLRRADAARCRSLRRVIVSGEALTPELRDRFLDAGLPAELHNLYGPTEASIDVTAWPCGLNERGRSSPIGRPIANVRIYVLDQNQRQTGIGVPGEIFIGGVAVARGYLNRPELTANCFKPDPFSDEPGARLYRTGDRGRIRPDGAIEYLGRADFQIKLRGHRIELGEIEATLRRCPGVRDAAAIVRGATALEQKIVAFVAADGASIGVDDVMRHARATLPGYMVPSVVMPVANMPLSANGKLDRRALSAIEAPRTRSHAVAPRNDAERRISAVWQRLLERTDIGVHDNFFDIGGNSLLLVQVHAWLRDAFERQLTLMDMFRMPTVASLAAYVSADPDEQRVPAVSPPVQSAALTAAAERAVAIIGMAGRFPGASDVDVFWENLVAGRESILRVDEAALVREGVDPQILTNPSYVPAVGALDQIDLFDADFFCIGPAEAQRLDPQGRLLLECAWEALEEAGIVAAAAESRVGVFAGGAISNYGLWGAQSDHGDIRTSGSAAYQLLLGNDKDYLPSRISYRLGLRGPSIAVQTSCSTSLVAVAQAVRALRDHDCDVALAGGVSVAVPHRVGYLQEDGAITSPNGRCRAFDADADGTVPGNGAGMVVLKRLKDAMRDGDPIRAVIRGAAVNNDGANKLGFTAPAPDGQEEVIRAALADASLPPAAIGFVEAHGTGTPLGDQVELSALARVFDDPATRPVLGSVKTNIGHPDAAAGVAGLIKAVLAVERGVIPPTLHFTNPNPLLTADAIGFTINTQARSWADQEGLRRAGVSSFGIGGTNAHVVVEQAPAAVRREPTVGSAHILALSARTRTALAAQARSLRQALSMGSLELASVAWTLQSGRRTFPWRFALLAQSVAHAATQLADPVLPSCAAPAVPPPCHFLFPGQGTQRSGMGFALYQTEPRFRADVDICLTHLDDTTARSVYESTFAGPTHAGAEALTRTAIAQPALFVMQFALARLLMSWGIKPACMIGHSLGEFVAATLAEVFPLDDAVRLIALRARLMQALPAGAMISVACSESEIARRLPESLAIAACNEAWNTVVAGSPLELKRFRDDLARDGIESVALPVSHAFHSSMMDPVVAPFAQGLGRVQLRDPTIPLVSTVTGRWMTPDEAKDPGYWAQHLRRTVRFSAALTTVSSVEAIFLELGPGTTLSSIVRRHGLDSVIPVLPLDLDEHAALGPRAALARLWDRGAAVDWAALHPSPRPVKVRLPTYPFERRRYWLAAEPTEPSKASAVKLFIPEWRAAARLSGELEVGRDFLIMAAATTEWVDLAERLRANRAERVAIDAAGGALTGKTVVLPLSARTRLPSALLEVAYLARRAAEQGARQLVLLTACAEDVSGAEEVAPVAAGMAAAALVVAQELPELACRVIDFEGGTRAASLPVLAREILAAGGARHVAIRGRRRFTPEYRPLPPPGIGALRSNGVYLITGAAGKLGRLLAHRLAQRHRARLVLVSRRPTELWAPSFAEGPADATIALSGNIADPVFAKAAVATALARFGRLDGVFHAAGIAGEEAVESIFEMSEAKTVAIVEPKLAGASAIADAVAGTEIDFVLLVSSLSTVLGGIGFAAYAAANRAMEAFAQSQSETLDQRWISVAFDALDLGPDAGAPMRLTERLAPEATLDLIERIIGSGLEGRIIVAAGDFARRHQDWVGPPSSGRRDAPASVPQTSSPPAAATEELVAAVWRGVLGHQTIGRNDDFFALGGDSLAAIRIISRLRVETRLPLTLRLALEASTVARMAALLDGLKASRKMASSGPVAMEAEEGEL